MACFPHFKIFIFSHVFLMWRVFILHWNSCECRNLATPDVNKRVWPRWPRTFGSVRVALSCDPHVDSIPQVLPVILTGLRSYLLDYLSWVIIQIPSGFYLKKMAFHVKRVVQVATMSIAVFYSFLLLYQNLGTSQQVNIIWCKYVSLFWKIARGNLKNRVSVC